MKETKREFFSLDTFDKILLVRLASGLLRFFLSIVTIMSSSGDKKWNNSKDNTLRVDPYHHRFCTSVFRCGKVFSFAKREPGEEGSGKGCGSKIFRRSGKRASCSAINNEGVPAGYRVRSD